MFPAVYVINGRLRANTSLPGAVSCCGVHARLSEKPDTTKWRPLNIEVQDIPFTRHLRGFLLCGAVYKKTEV